MLAHVHRSLPILVIILVTLMVTNSSIYVPCLPYIRDEFSTSDSVAQFVIVINPLVAIFMNLIFGFLCDFHERKTLLMISIACFMVGCVICGFSFNTETFLLGRLLQATGDAGIAVLTLTILHSVNGKTFAYYLGVLSIFFAITWVLAPILGAQVLDWFGWRYNFHFIFLSVLFVSTLLLYRLPRNFGARKVLSAPSFLKLLKDSCSILKIPSFSIPTLGSALAVGIFGTFETFAPFIYIDIFKLSPIEFSLIHCLILCAHGASALLYISVIRTRTAKTALACGTYLYIVFTFGNLLLLFHILPSSPLFTSIFASFATSSLPFLTSAATLYALKGIKKQEGLAVALIFICRNIAHVVISLMTTLFYDRTLDSLWAVSLIFSLFIIALLRQTRRLKITNHTREHHAQAQVRKKA